MRTNSRPARTTCTRGRAVQTLLSAALVAVGVSSCSLLPFGPGSGPSTQALADGSGFLVSAPSNFFQEAIVSGRLALIGDNCVGLEMEASGESAALTFPHGTRPSDDGRAIVLPDGLQIALGDPIYGGGGYLTLSDAPDAFTSWPDAPSGCGQATYLANIHDVSVGERQ